MKLNNIYVIVLALLFFLESAFLFSIEESVSNMENYDGKIFYNIGNKTPFTKTFFEILKWQFIRKPGSWPKEEIKNDFHNFDIVEKSEKTKITFLNHASFLIQTQNKNIIIDPVYSGKIGFKILGKIVGPKRVRKPAIDFEKLPHIDYVLISHNHFDHMDIPTLEKLSKRAEVTKSKTTFILPMKNTNYLEKAGIKNSDFVNIKELNWFEKEIVNSGLAIHSVPAQHWSKRGFFDDNKSLWCGFVIESLNKFIYIAGDTGLGEHFKIIKNKFSKIDLAILPIGSYKPE